jgi:hypothetical protein
VTTDHGGSKFADTTEGGVAEGVAAEESVSESHAGPNRTGSDVVELDAEDTQ